MLTPYKYFYLSSLVKSYTLIGIVPLTAISPCQSPLQQILFIKKEKRRKQQNDNDEKCYCLFLNNW